jgi:NhaP-type Na+/H+ or K+/H+ antiporter
MTGHLELWVLGLLAAVAGLVMLSNRLGVPHPVFLVLGGLALGLIPIVPEIGLPPDLVLLIFLPPLLYSAAFFSSPRDLKANLRPIASLSIGLVLLTTITVALVAHLVVGLPWAAAFVLGAIVSPTAPRNRLQLFGLWDVLPFLLNSVLFILIGLQLPNILESISGEYAMMSVVLYAALVSLAVIGTRLLWTFPATYLPRYLSRSMRERNPSPPWQQVAAVAYTGMRGAISLAAALAIPLTVQNGASFPGRDQILFLTFCVILVTLVVQGMSLPLLIRRLGLAEAEGEEEREETEARLRAAEAALAKLDELADEARVREDTTTRMRDLYEYRRRRFAARHSEQSESGEEGDGYEERSLAYQRFRREMLGVERAELLRLRSEGRISDEVRRRVERDLDLEDARLEI